jgi:hypothetical protein
MVQISFCLPLSRVSDGEKRREGKKRRENGGGEGRRWQRRGIETRDYTIRERRGRVGKVENEGWSVRRRKEGLNATTKKAGQEKQANARQGRARQGRAGQGKVGQGRR